MNRFVEFYLVHYIFISTVSKYLVNHAALLFDHFFSHAVSTYSIISFFKLNCTCHNFHGVMLGFINLHNEQL